MQPSQKEILKGRIDLRIKFCLMINLFLILMMESKSLVEMKLLIRDFSMKFIINHIIAKSNNRK